MTGRGERQRPARRPRMAAWAAALVATLVGPAAAAAAPSPTGPATTTAGPATTTAGPATTTTGPPAAGPATTTGPATASTAPAGPQEVLGTSLLSVRRLPAFVDNHLAAQKFAPRLAAFMANPGLAGSGVQSCLEVSQGDDVIYAAHATTELLPASNMKLLTTFAALDKLGPSFRFTTTVEAAQKPVGGVVSGNLYLIGGGDPFLRTADYLATFNPPEPLYTSLAQLAAQVKAAGVRQVDGAVVGDESRYDALRTVPTWKPVYAQEGDAGPLSALEVNDGFQMPGEKAAAQPAVMAAEVLTTLLDAEGVPVGGAAATATTPSTAVPVTTIQSAPLSQIVQAILVPSDDTAAELLTKELGHDFGTGGTTAAGVAVIRADLAADGLPVSQLVGLDGSGLDRGDQVSCALLDDALTRAGGWRVLAAALPVAGQTGTLRDRFKGTPAAGRLLAKTGTLDDVSSLSGYVTARPGLPTPQLSQALVFSFLMNGVTDVEGALLGDQLGVTLAAYPAVPPLSALSPLPPRPGFPGGSSP